MNAFVTGSRVYGRPRPDSDVDLVVLVDDATLDILDELAEGSLIEKKRGDATYEGRQMKFGNLNLIVTTEPKMYQAWLKGTEELEKKRPVTREQAIKVLKRYREAAAEDISAGRGP